MKTRTKPAKPAARLTRLGVSRQVAIPKALHDELGLAPGDYLKAEVKGGRLVLTPQTLITKRLGEGLEDVKKGRVYGPFGTAKEMVRSLRAAAKRARKPEKAH